MITSISQLDLEKEYTYSDYLSWRIEQFVELIKGRVMPRSAPSRRHQEVSINLATSIHHFLKANLCECKIYHAPFYVRLLKKTVGKTAKDIHTVVQPDLCVVCDLSKLDDKGCLGAPDLIIEILSEGNSKRDVSDKFALYQENGVREYWLVRPAEKNVERFFLENDLYAHKGFFTDEMTISPIILPELQIDLREIFSGHF